MQLPTRATSNWYRRVMKHSSASRSCKRHAKQLLCLILSHTFALGSGRGELSSPRKWMHRQVLSDTRKTNKCPETTWSLALHVDDPSCLHKTPPTNSQERKNGRKLSAPIASKDSRNPRGWTHFSDGSRKVMSSRGDFRYRPNASPSWRRRGSCASRGAMVSRNAQPGHRPTSRLFECEGHKHRRRSLCFNRHGLGVCVPTCPGRYHAAI